MRSMTDEVEKFRLYLALPPHPPPSVVPLPLQGKVSKPAAKLQFIALIQHLESSIQYPENPHQRRLVEKVNQQAVPPKKR